MTVIQSQGLHKPVSKAYPFTGGVTQTTGASAGYAPLLRGDAAVTYEALFQTQPILYAAIMKRVKGIARNPLKAYEFGLDGDSRVRARSHPIAGIIKKPFPYGYEFGWKAAIAKDLNIHGQALGFKVRERGAGSTPIEFWPVPWRFVTVYRDEHNNVLGYEVNIGGTSYTVGREEVVHFEMPGGSPLAPLRRTLALEDASQIYQGENIRNGMAPRTAFTTEGRLPDNTIPRLRAELEKLYTGAENAGKVGIFDQGLKPNKIGMSPVDLDLISQRKLSRDEVCAVFDMAPALLGLEHGTFNSTSEYRRALYDSIATDLVLIEETFQAQFITPELAWDGIFVEFDTNELLRPDPETRARMHMLTQQAGVTSINERRQFENLAPIEDPTADAVMAPLNMQVVGGNVDEVASMSMIEKINAIGALIRAGFSPEDAVAALGLAPMEYLAVRPITVAPLAIDAQQLDPTADPMISPEDVVDPSLTTSAGTPSQGATDPNFLVNAITDALINRPKSRRIIRDEDGNISQIIEE